MVGCVAGEVTENVPTERNMSCWFGRRASALQNGWRVNIVSGHPCPEELPTALAEWVMYDIVCRRWSRLLEDSPLARCSPVAK